jgi:hypothetical protein
MDRIHSYLAAWRGGSLRTASLMSLFMCMIPTNTPFTMLWSSGKAVEAAMMARGGCWGRVLAAGGIYHGIVLMVPIVLSWWLWWLPSALVTSTSPACMTPPARSLAGAVRALHCVGRKPCMLHDALLSSANCRTCKRVPELMKVVI